MSAERIAVLITCHNRRENTLSCLRALFVQDLPVETTLSVYLVDDGSTDGTSEAVSSEFPSVRVIRGDGSLYWAGGMRVAWAEAMKSTWDYYLWLNDDVILYPGAVLTMLTTASEVSRKEGRIGIIVGNCRDPHTGRITYGGYIKGCRGLVEPSDKYQSCYTMNGNVVLIPHQVVATVGNLRVEFRHYAADQDYGFRAREKGFIAYVAPGFQGMCRQNDPACPWADPNTPFRQRWRIMHSPKGQRPYETYLIARKYHGFLWPIDVIKLYLKVSFPRTYDYFRRHMGGKSAHLERP
jgi:GT2 family glycosyltransferase